VLAPAGEFVIVVLPSRAENPTAGEPIERLARDHGLEVVTLGARAFRSLDGVAHRLRRRA
jgi:hypothetical protein